MTSPAISTAGLSKHYGDFVALKDLDLQVHTGEIFGFLGPNGAGKSTAIKALLDQVRPTRGNASVLGLDAHRDAKAIRARIGYIPGDLALYPRLTGRATLDYFARLRGGVRAAYVEELAERFEADLSKKVGEYSTGNRQKIGLIQAFMHEPELLILDEPNSGLDPLLQEVFHQLLEEVRDQGRTIFLSSHTLSEVERVADRVGIIKDGSLIVVERVDALKRKAIRHVDFEFSRPVVAPLLRGVDGVHEVVIDDRKARVAFEGDADALLRAVVDTQEHIVSMTSRESDLEEIFLTYYRGAGSTSHAD
ncbi:MAG: ABC transporter ATP-binding protein [Ornithinimicrobium sp.]